MTLAHEINSAAPEGRRVALIFAAAERHCGLRVCAWCGDWLGLAHELPEGAITHGCCPRCEAVMREEMEKLSPAVVQAPVFPACVSALAGFGEVSPTRLPVRFLDAVNIQPEAQNAA